MKNISELSTLGEKLFSFGLYRLCNTIDIESFKEKLISFKDIERPSYPKDILELCTFNISTKEFCEVLDFSDREKQRQFIEHTCGSIFNETITIISLNSKKCCHHWLDEIVLRWSPDESIQITLNPTLIAMYLEKKINLNSFNKENKKMNNMDVLEKILNKLPEDERNFFNFILSEIRNKIMSSNEVNIDKYKGQNLFDEENWTGIDWEDFTLVTYVDDYLAFTGKKKNRRNRKHFYLSIDNIFGKGFPCLIDDTLYDMPILIKGLFYDNIDDYKSNTKCKFVIQPGIWNFIKNELCL